MPKGEPLRLAIIGAGPVGLEAALYARSLNFTVAVFERGEVGEHLSRWGHVKLFTPFAWNHSPLGAALIRREHPQHAIPGGQDLLTGIELRDNYMMPLSLTSLLCDCIRMKSTVLHIGRGNLTNAEPATDPRRTNQPFRILSCDDKQREQIDEVDAVIDCSGTFSDHRWLGSGGIPAIGERVASAQISYGLEDITGTRKAYYAGRSIIVIGGGYSAATTVCQLATLAEQNPATWIVWLNRGARSTPLPRMSTDPLRERDRLAARANNLATRGDGNVEYHANMAIDSIESHGTDRGFRVAGHCGSEEMSWEVERVIANVGHRPDFDFCRELHVAGPSVMQPEPGYFVLGAKSSGWDQNFLLKQAFDQIRDVFARLTGKPKLNLYEGKLAA